MKRRDMLSLSLLGPLMLHGCRRAERVTLEPEPEEAPPRREGQELVPVDADPSRQIRTVVGLRPFRPSGFVVRREERGEKVLIHNFGHGGGGVTLSWGCARLALDQAGALAGRDCAVIGGGVMGLSVARLLQLEGARVTLYARDLPPETTSNVAGAQWWPVSVYDSSRRTPKFSAQFVEAANFSYRYFQNLLGPRWGVRWVPNYYLSEGDPANGWMGGPGGVLHHLQVGFRDFGPGEHVFPARFARRFHTMLIEPATYLENLMREVRDAGAKVEIRDFTSADEILRLPQPVIFNCTGLGARELFDDPELIPVKGQLSVLLPQPEVNYNLISDRFYMFPRSDGIILGGTYQRGRSDLAPDSDLRAQVLEGHRTIFTEMARLQAERLDSSRGI